MTTVQESLDRCVDFACKVSLENSFAKTAEGSLNGRILLPVNVAGNWRGAVRYGVQVAAPTNAELRLLDVEKSNSRPAERITPMHIKSTRT